MTGSPSSMGPPCPENEAWIRLAAGLTSAEEGESLLTHAAGCRNCAERLRDLADAVADGEASEQPELQFPPIQPDRRTQLATRMAKQGAVLAMPRRRSRNQLVWMGLAASLAFAVGGGAWFFRQQINTPPLTELARAYSAHRNLALQIPGAANAPLAADRGGRAVADLPAALLDSQSRIRRHLDAQPNDPAWLHAEGRAALLVWDFDTALRSFQAAADLGEKSPAFYIDFGSAYFERAERNGNALDYANALEKLGTALQLEPRNLTALFNRAVIRAILFQYDPAAADFSEYIRREQDAGWREEAKRRLDDLRKRRAQVFEGGSPPKELAAELALAGQMTGGLRDYFARAALAPGEVATDLATVHGEPWLREVLALTPSPAVARASVTLTALARLRTTASTQYDAVTDKVRALEAVRLPAPLAVWLSYELLYHRTRTTAVNECPDGSALEQASRRYPWFDAQILLEESLCAAGRQDFTTAMMLIDKAGSIAGAHRFEDTAIRVENYRGQRFADTGFYSEAAQTAISALGRMERGGYPIRRAYDFHVIFIKAANQLHLAHAATGAATMTASVSRAAGTRVFEMISDSQIAQLDLTLGHDEEAGRAWDEAHALFTHLGENPEAAVYWRVMQAGWLETHHDREGLYRILADARREAPASGDRLYFTRRIVAALCRLELANRDFAAVEDIAAQFWRDADQMVSARPSAARAYLAEIESVTRSLTASRLMAGKTKEALAAWQRFIALDERLKGGRESGDADAFQQAGDATLTVADLDDRAALWLSTHGGVSFQWADESYTDLIARVRKLRRLCSISATPEPIVTSEARKLFRILFPGGTGGKRVGIESTGELNTLPLSIFLLVDEGKNSDYAFLPFGGEMPSGTRKPVQITTIAATVFDNKLAPAGDIAPSLREEADAAAAPFVARRSLQGGAATARAVDQAALESGILHFAGHAIPWHGSIGLLVAPDASDSESGGRQGVWEMSRPRSMKADLVVFSACSTASFNDPASVRPGQLTESALLAGAREAVASSWDVDSEATAAWMQRFYRHVAAGEPAAAAVRMAATEMRAETRWNQPRYWAAFSDYARGAKKTL